MRPFPDVGSFTRCNHKAMSMTSNLRGIRSVFTWIQLWYFSVQMFCASLIMEMLFMMTVLSRTLLFRKFKFEQRSFSKSTSRSHHTQMLWVFQVMPLHFSHLLRIPFQFSLGKSVHLNHPARVIIQASACRQLPSPKLTTKKSSNKLAAFFYFWPCSKMFQKFSMLSR